MASGNTGGHLAAPLWHSFMQVAHRDMNIPTIPGLEPHPVQVAEMQRLAELKKNEPQAAQEQASASSSRGVSEQTREALKRIMVSIRKASGLGDADPPPGSSDPVQVSHSRSRRVPRSGPILRTALSVRARPGDGSSLHSWCCVDAFLSPPSP